MLCNTLKQACIMSTFTFNNYYYNILLLIVMKANKPNFTEFKWLHR